MSARFHGYVALVLSGQLGFGLAAVVLFSLFIPGTPHPLAWAPGLMAAVLASGALCVPRAVLKNYRSHIARHRRMLGGMLLGSSLAAVLWQIMAPGRAGWLVLTGLCIRWFLFGAETIRLERADRMKLPGPSAATQTRRGITIVTGVLIPLLLLAGAPALPWLWFSFLLTLFCQWTITAEWCHARGSSLITDKCPAA